MVSVKSVLVFVSGVVVGALAGAYTMFYHGYYTQRLELVGSGGDVIASDERGPTESFGDE